MPESTLLDCSNNISFANSIISFFSDKITVLGRALLHHQISSHFSHDNKASPPSFTSFSPVMEDDVFKIIKQSPIKSCSLDPWPTYLVKECIDILITLITNVINLSIKEGSFLSCFKEGLITPLIKKPKLPNNEF